MRVLGCGHGPRTLKKILRSAVCRPYYSSKLNVRKWEDTMAWTTPVLVEICVGLEINGYMPADGYVPPEF